MKENTNNAIVVNSIILYIRLFITAVTGLFTTRFALQALGADDFGLFSVIGGVISFIAIINTIMAGTSNRFIATAIGRDNLLEINKTFNINLVCHIAIACLILIIAFPIGEWYIHNFVNYTGDIEKVIWVYRITIIGSVISVVGVPYYGLLMAKERFLVFSSVDSFSQILKAVVAYLLIDHFSGKLIIYASTLSFITAYPTIIYAVYCHIKFRGITKLRFVRDLNSYRSVLGFSVWVGYGALATIGKSQGAALLVNAFFNTIMNTALGIANTVNGILLVFANNVTKSISPQITKSYAAGNLTRSENLVIIASKISFLLMLFVSVPFLIIPDYIFNIWLGRVPEYAVIFTYLIIIDSLIGTLNAGIPDLIFAMGNIKWYQLSVNTLYLASIGVGFLVLRTGAPAYFLLITYITFSLIVLVVRQIILKKIVKINNKRIIYLSYTPSFIVAILFCLIYFLPGEMHPILRMILAYLYLANLIYFIGLTKKERNTAIKIVLSKF